MSSNSQSPEESKRMTTNEAGLCEIVGSQLLDMLRDGNWQSAIPLLEAITSEKVRTATIQKSAQILAASNDVEKALRLSERLEAFERFESLLDIVDAIAVEDEEARRGVLMHALACVEQSHDNILPSSACKLSISWASLNSGLIDLAVKTATDLDPNNIHPDTLVDLIRSIANLGHVLAATEVAEKYFDSYPHYHMAMIGIGQALGAAGKWEEAGEFFDVGQSEFQQRDDLELNGWSRLASAQASIDSGDLIGARTEIGWTLTSQIWSLLCDGYDKEACKLIDDIISMICYVDAGGLEVERFLTVPCESTNLIYIGEFAGRNKRSPCDSEGEFRHSLIKAAHSSDPEKEFTEIFDGQLDSAIKFADECERDKAKDFFAMLVKVSTSPPEGCYEYCGLDCDCWLNLTEALMIVNIFYGLDATLKLLDSEHSHKVRSRLKKVYDELGLW